MLLRAQQWKGEEALLGIRATLPKRVFMATSPDSGHTAAHRSAKIRQSRNSYVRKTLAEIPPRSLENKVRNNEYR